jgi:hypothetical protein
MFLSRDSLPLLPLAGIETDRAALQIEGSLHGMENIADGPLYLRVIRLQFQRVVGPEGGNCQRRERKKRVSDAQLHCSP